MTATTAERAALSILMREGSAAEHQDAETSDFMSSLLDGRVNETGYTEYLAMLRPVYAALETVAGELADHPVVGSIVDRDLDRLAAIDADLQFWSKGAVRQISSPAVDAYVARVLATRADPVLYAAHHYTRYLGDLSGGQAIGRILSRTFGLEPGQGVAFYGFATIAKPKPYKDGYRARLDALPMTEAEQDRVVDEVRAAFGLNGALFAELTAQLPRYAR